MGGRELSAVALAAGPAAGLALAFVRATLYERLQAKAVYTSVGCNLLPEKFTIADLRDLTGHLLGQSLDNSRFRDRLKKSNTIIECPGEIAI